MQSILLALVLPTLIEGFSTTTFLVTRLEEYRTNTFNLSASTIKGTAVYQHVLPSASTNAAAPGPVMNLTVARPDGPIFTTVRVTWELPSILQRNSEIVKFMLSHNATGGNLNYQYPPEEINVNINIKTVTRNLEVIPENTYYIEVYAIGTDSTLRQYIGQKSTIIYIAPAGAPDPPEVLTCKASTDTTITLTWAAPHQRNDDPIQYYVVNSVTTGVMFSTTSNMTEYTVDYGLQPATAYVFSVASVNEAVKSVNQRTYSSQIGCTTKATTTENEASSLFIPGVVMMIAAVFTILLGAGLWIAFRRNKMCFRRSENPKQMDVQNVQLSERGICSDATPSGDDERSHYQTIRSDEIAKPSVYAEIEGSDQVAVADYQNDPRNTK